MYIYIDDEDDDNQGKQQKITIVITLIWGSNNNIRKMRATTSAMTLGDYRHCVIAVDIYDTGLSSLERRWQERQIMRRWRIWLRMNAVLAQFGREKSDVHMWRTIWGTHGHRYHYGYFTDWAVSKPTASCHKLQALSTHGCT